jgi:kumamolisin
MKRTFLLSFCAVFSAVPLSFAHAADQIWEPPTSAHFAYDIGVRSHTDYLVNLTKSNAFLDYGPALPLHGPAVFASSPGGLVPAQLRSAYGLASTGGSGVIAIVDAYDDPNAVNDFNVFASQFGLPQETGSGSVFQVVFAGGTRPKSNGGWAQEESLDFEWAHALAPNAKIVLVEAASNSNANLYAAEDVAKQIAGVKEVSNSWGGGESSGETALDSHFVQSGVVFFASGGDSGGAIEYPSSSVNVVSCGGTSLKMSGTTNLGETAWSGTGCGVSAYEPIPSFQSGIPGVTGSGRNTDDISAIADPNTGVSVYDSFTYRGLSGWLVFGGTSVACPCLAAMHNMSGSTLGSSAAENAHIYASLGGSSLHDILSGTAGSFSAGAGYDKPTGVGSPNGHGAF